MGIDQISSLYLLLGLLIADVALLGIWFARDSKSIDH
jgi:hypothetical protein